MTKREHQKREYLGEAVENPTPYEPEPIPDNLLTHRLREHFTESQVEVIYAAVNSVCSDCHNNPPTCRCWEG